ncbi:MAG: lipoprotein-releasing ABC transporter permease subunit [Halieaceae bacterium]|nr:lipoprotein-releasing ABC transporter permease subunit [Halieaceae bacterium]
MALLWQLALRYSFGVRRQGFARLVSSISVAGMTLGVVALIVVMSVMNGFSREITQRILSVVPHLFVEHSVEQPLEWEQALRQQDGVVAVSSYLRTQALLSSGSFVSGARIMGVDTNTLADVSPWLDTVSVQLERAEHTRFGVVLSNSLAASLAVTPGDDVKMTLPDVVISPFGVFPKTKTLHVVGVFDLSINQSSADAFMTLATAERLLRRDMDGWQVRGQDLWLAPALAAQINRELNRVGLSATDWTETQGSLFASIRMEKRMVAVLLFLVVVVAAFNLIATLAMSVQSRRKDIAVLGMMGLSQSQLMVVFLLHGLLMAFVAIALGTLVGVVLAINLPGIVSLVELAFGFKLFDPTVYFISDLPSHLLWSDVFWVVAIALLLSALASVYPALRAERISPAEVLRYE